MESGTLDASFEVSDSSVNVSSNRRSSFDRGAESEEYESANEGDTEGESAIVVRQEIANSVTSSTQVSPTSEKKDVECELQDGSSAIADLPSSEPVDGTCANPRPIPASGLGDSDHFAPEEVETREAETSDNTDNDERLLLNGSASLIEQQNGLVNGDQPVHTTEDDSPKSEYSSDPRSVHPSNEDMTDPENAPSDSKQTDESMSSSGEPEPAGESDAPVQIGMENITLDSETATSPLAVSVTDEPLEDNDKTHPAYIPRQGNFYMHDLRTNDDEEADAERVGNRPAAAQQRDWRPSGGKWQHDLYEGEASSPQSSSSPAHVVRDNAEAANAPRRDGPENPSLKAQSSARRRNVAQTRPARNKPPADVLPGDARFLQDREQRDWRRRANKPMHQNRNFNRSHISYSTTEDEQYYYGGYGANERMSSLAYPGHAYRGAAGGGYRGGGGRGFSSTLPNIRNKPPPPANFPQQPLSTGPKPSRYHESDDSGYNVDDVEQAFPRFAHPPERAMGRYHAADTEHTIDDGSRHGAFFTAREVRKPVSKPNERTSDLKSRKQYDANRRQRDDVRPEDDASSSRRGGAAPRSGFNCRSSGNGASGGWDRSEDSGNSQRRSARSRERDSRNGDELDTRRGKKSDQTSPRNKLNQTSSKKPQEYKHPLDRTDSSDFDNDPRNWRRETFETPPRFGRMGSGGNAPSAFDKSPSNYSSGKKVGVTRPFVHENLNTSGGFDSDPQFGYVASEEQDHSDGQSEVTPTSRGGDSKRYSSMRPPAGPETGQFAEQMGNPPVSLRAPQSNPVQSVQSQQMAAAAAAAASMQMQNAVAAAASQQHMAAMNAMLHAQRMQSSLQNPPQYQNFYPQHPAALAAAAAAAASIINPGGGGGVPAGMLAYGSPPMGPIGGHLQSGSGGQQAPPQFGTPPSNGNEAGSLFLYQQQMAAAAQYLQQPQNGGGGDLDQGIFGGGGGISQQSGYQPPPHPSSGKPPSIDNDC